MGENIQDYLNRGMYGNKETNVDERKLFLSTLRERVIVALTNRQVMKNETYAPIVELIKIYPDCHMYLDGDLDYSYLSKYIKIVNKLNIPFTIFNDVNHETEFGLVLATKSRAINKNDIFVPEVEF
ncbi:YueI family protein [Cytobacillus suaedae]|nr:YueI family protein [Cytobacillus suaedae]